MCPLFAVTVMCYHRRCRNDPEEVGCKPGMFKGQKKELQQNEVSAGGVTVSSRGA